MANLIILRGATAKQFDRDGDVFDLKDIADEDELPNELTFDEIEFVPTTRIETLKGGNAVVYVAEGEE